MKKTILNDVKITCDNPVRHYYFQSMEQYAKSIESWVNDFHDFIRDHRSQDPVSLNVEREYLDVCEFCESTWEVDDSGCPVCCGKAQDEWDLTHKKESVYE